MTPTDAKKAAIEQEIRDNRRNIDFNIRDFVIEFIVKKFQDDNYYIPEYQRKFVWDNVRKSRFIESVFLGLPIPMMFFAEMEQDGRLEIVDGAQRVQTLEEFVSGDLKLSNIQKLSSLNGLKFGDLSTTTQNKFLNSPLRIVVLDERSTPEVRQEIFDRINTSALKAKPSEIRAGSYSGPFMTFIGECAKDEVLVRLCPVSKTLELRREREELVLRFFAYSDEYLKFRHSVEKFLDVYIKKHKDKAPKASMRTEFNGMLHFVEKYLPGGFSKGEGSKSTPRVRFEALAVGVNLALRKKPDLVPASMSWINSKEFSDQTRTHASNSGPRLKKRIEFVRDQLLSST